jgi:hypothetical protein
MINNECIRLEILAAPLSRCFFVSICNCRQGKPPAASGTINEQVTDPVCPSWLLEIATRCLLFLLLFVVSLTTGSYTTTTTMHARGIKNMMGGK